MAIFEFVLLNMIADHSIKQHCLHTLFYCFFACFIIFMLETGHFENTLNSDLISHMIFSVVCLFNFLLPGWLILKMFTPPSPQKNAPHTCVNLLILLLGDTVLTMPHNHSWIIMILAWLSLTMSFCVHIAIKFPWFEFCGRHKLLLRLFNQSQLLWNNSPLGQCLGNVFCLHKASSHLSLSPVFSNKLAGFLLIAFHHNCTSFKNTLGFIFTCFESEIRSFIEIKSYMSWGQLLPLSKISEPWLCW